MRAAAPVVALVVLCLALAGCDRCGNWIQVNTPKVPGTCAGQSQPR